MDDDGETTNETPMYLRFNLKMHLYLCFFVVDQYLRLMGDKKDSRLGGASSGIVLSPIRRRYRSTTSRCSGFL